jgi:hypothetical protein
MIKNILKRCNNSTEKSIYGKVNTTDFGRNLIKRIKMGENYKLASFKMKEFYLTAYNMSRKKAQVLKIVIFGYYVVMTQNSPTGKVFRVQRKRIPLH